jgi:Ser/Thr protein kinase RdoA (MazF antagonist)
MTSTHDRWFVNVDAVADKTSLGRTDLEVIESLERASARPPARRPDSVRARTRPAGSGGSVARMDAYAVSVFGFLDGTAHAYGEFPDNTLRRRVLAALGRMHRATRPRASADRRAGQPRGSDRKAFEDAHHEL